MAKEETSEKGKEAKDIVDIYGGFGRWHLKMLLCCSVVGVFMNWHALGYVFYAFPMDHWCARPPEFSNMTVKEWRNLSIPREVRKGKEAFSQCFMYDMSNYTSEVDEEGSPFWKPHDKVPCKDWEFDTSFYQRTISSQFNLVCNQAFLISLSQSVFMAGILVAVFVCGQIADKIGRRPVVVFSTLVTIAAGFGQSFANSYPFFAAMRFFVAMGSYGLFTTGYIVLMEISTPEMRPVLNVFIMSGWATGFVTLSGVAWLTRNWFIQSLVVAIGTITYLLLIWLLPESPRWLLTQRKFERAQTILEKQAKANRAWNQNTPIMIDNFMNKLEQEASKQSPKKFSIIDCLRTPNMRKKTLISYYAWFITSFVYYGLSLNTGQLGGSPFVTFAIFGAAEFPSLLVSYLSIRYVGRKVTLCVALLVAALCCLGTIPVGDNLVWLRVTLAMLGKSGVGVAFSVLYIFTAELFPTVIRSVGVGTSSTMARVGAIVAPFVKELGKATHPSVPMGIFGGVAILGALLVLLQPETRNQSLPDTIEQGEQFGKKRRRSATTNGSTSHL